MGDTASMVPLVERQSDTVSLSKRWHVLGPFKTGTREATWGADPLEVLGGFRNLTHDPTATFASALGVNGTVGWSVLGAGEIESGDNYSKATIDVGFPGIDWPFLQSVYGWAALQYQAWARGSIAVSGTDGQTVALYTDGLLEVWIDGMPYFGGDFYTYRRSPIVMKLSPGSHVIDLRLVRDVRAFGGIGEPRINAVIEVQKKNEALELDASSLLVAEAVDGKLVSPYGSITLRNNQGKWLEATGVQPVDSTGLMLSLLESPLILAPYQSRPAGLKIKFDDRAASNFSFEFTYKVQSDDSVRTSEPVTANITQRTMEEAQKITFLHPSGIVSYAILRPPLNQTCGSKELPVLIDLHGAGLEASSDQVRHMLDAAYGICAWILFPTGGTAWSGDDWHTWGAADVQAAVAAIPDWINAVEWKGAGVAVDDWFVSGHSNGGQGTWFLVTHQPDKVIAAAPVSGYSSIENYVPFTMWNDGQAAITNIIQTARQSFKHELLMENLAGIPVLQQHGSADDNVPAYHSRLLHQLISESSWQSDYHELPGENHWFDGILTTPQLLDFYSLHTQQPSYNNLLPEEFSVSVPASGDMGSRGGIAVDQLTSPDKYGHIEVIRQNGGRLWRLKTRNVNRFHLVPSRVRAVYPAEIIVDGTETPFAIPAHTAESTWLIKDHTGSWTISQDNNWRGISNRYGRQNGAMDAILRTQGRFTIRTCSSEGEAVALQISRNLFQYFAADSLIQAGYEDPISNSEPGNVITVVTGDDLPPSLLDTFPIHVGAGRITVETGPQSNSRRTGFDFEPGLGAIYLRPLTNERLELVVWGADSAGLQQASRLVPLVTGVGQPDFVVLGSQCRWKGHAGVYAAGFFDFNWRVSGGSYVV
ncbi:hypothetical protein FQN53_002594 [Emmonsiellopsis sp. PD_33]|nr:hypothetical protein FQN53_002594 [Emmonsiellopsis sp. PD_33]